MPVACDPEGVAENPEFDYDRAMHVLTPVEQIQVFDDLNPFGANSYDGTKFDE